MKTLFLIICIIELIIQINSIVKLKKTKEEKYWNIFIGITISNFISIAIAYITFAINALGLSDALACLIICGLSLISTIIILIIGLINKKNIKTTKTAFKTGIIFTVINIFVIICIPLIIDFINIKIGEKKVITYLNNKYGESNYKTKNVYKEYSNSGMWDKYLSGYHYELTSDYMNDLFIITTDKEFHYIDSDYFLPVYYSQKYNLKYNLEYTHYNSSLNYNFSEFDDYIREKLKEKYMIENIDVRGIYKNYVKSWNNISGTEYNENYNIVLENNGKIPSIEELIDKLIEQKDK